MKKKSKWRKVIHLEPPKDRKFYAILIMTIYDVAILSWSDMDNCWYTSPLANPKAKIFIENIVWWRELPNLPKNWL
jgi:hypothetical protein